MTGRTNQFIVNHVHRNYNLLKIINSMINNSKIQQTDVDLQQYIYQVLMLMDNEKLNNLYYKKDELIKFIKQIIRNQRNNSRMFYNTITLTNMMVELNDEIDIPEDDKLEHNYKLDFLMNIFENVDFFVTGKTQSELRITFSLTLLYLYFHECTPKWKLCGKYRIGMSTLNLLLKEAKSYVRNLYNENYDLYEEKTKSKL